MKLLRKKFKVVQKVDWRYYNLNGKLIREEGKYFVKRNGLISRFYLNAFLNLSGNIVHGGTIMFTTATLASRFYTRAEAEQFLRALEVFPERFEIIK